MWHLLISRSSSLVLMTSTFASFKMLDTSTKECQVKFFHTDAALTSVNVNEAGITSLRGCSESWATEDGKGGKENNLHAEQRGWNFRWKSRTKNDRYIDVVIKTLLYPKMRFLFATRAIMLASRGSELNRLQTRSLDKTWCVFNRDGFWWNVKYSTRDSYNITTYTKAWSLDCMWTYLYSRFLQVPVVSFWRSGPYCNYWQVLVGWL